MRGRRAEKERAASRQRAASATATAILIVTRNLEVAGSTSDEATGVLTWLLRTCPTAHSDCSKLGDEKYVTGKYPSWRIITIGHGPARSRSTFTRDKTIRRPDPGVRLWFSLRRVRATIHIYVCCARRYREIWRPDEKHARISHRESNGGVTRVTL